MSTLCNTCANNEDPLKHDSRRTKITCVPTRNGDQSEYVAKAKLQDSGNRTDIAGTGAMRDMAPGKGRCDLLPANALTSLHEFLEKDTAKGNDIFRQWLINCYMQLLEYLNNPSEETSLLRGANYILAAMEYKEQYFSDTRDQDAPDSFYSKVKYPYPLAIIRLAVHYENGAKKYSDRNWEKGLPISNFLDSGIRHCLKAIDGWEDEDHLAAVAWNILGAGWTLARYPELQDLPLQRS